MKFGVVTFPGSNCDYDAYAAVQHVLGEEAEFLWHKSSDLMNVDVVILPGGFSYGDYLRAGAIARFSPIMQEVVKFANSGGLVVGICNGFQVLTEVGLLPGALIRNSHLRFSGKYVHVRVESTDSPFTCECTAGETLKIPIAHGEGNFYHFEEDIRTLEESGQILFKYVTADGDLTADANPNGSRLNIAGIRNAEGNVMGMMPHPERAVESILGSTDGLKIFQSLQTACHATKTVGAR